MATAKKNSSEKNPLDDTQIITLYMDSVLSNNHEPKNVFHFCKSNNIEESDFYSFYGSLDAIKQDIWNKFFLNAKQSLTQDENFESYSNRNKLLSLYFTLFEVMTLNRSYVAFALETQKEGLKTLKQLKEFRSHFKDFVKDILSTSASEQDVKIQKFMQPVITEGAWIQLLFLIKFWLDDTSKGFEKTDIMIEKSVKATFDVLDTTPLESLFDLGKFIWKEKLN